MKVKDLMSRNVIAAGAAETLAKALSKMKSARIHQLVITDGKTPAGMLELKSIITKDVDLTATKVSNFIKKSPSLGSEDDITHAIEMLLGSGMRALPVIDKGSLVGIISETDIMKVAGSIVRDKNTSLRDIMTVCVYVDKEEKASKIKNLMFETNVSRIPVLDGDDVIGVVGTLDLIKVLEAKSSPDMRGGRTQEKSVSEKIKTSDISAEAIMSKPVVLAAEKRLLDAIPLLQKNEELVIKNGEIGIITPKDVLELAAKTGKKGVYVQITGMHEEGIDFQKRMDAAVQSFVNKYTRMIDNIEYLVVHAEKMHKQGPKQKYSVRVRFKAPFGFFVSHAWGWKPLDVIQEAFNKMEREIARKYDPIKEHEKAKKGKAMRRM
ncbi:MAG: CBS domain-containing protein [Candidatus Aenigmarchaeota archaeon]|nr:CBS domain-containing protein [Candidatus Aenigmarchaeota archaeon]